MHWSHDVSINFPGLIVAPSWATYLGHKTIKKSSVEAHSVIIDSDTVEFYRHTWNKIQCFRRTYYARSRRVYDCEHCLEQLLKQVGYREMFWKRLLRLYNHDTGKQVHKHVYSSNENPFPVRTLTHRVHWENRDDLDVAHLLQMPTLESHKP